MADLMNTTSCKVVSTKPTSTSAVCTDPPRLVVSERLEQMDISKTTAPAVKENLHEKAIGFPTSFLMVKRKRPTRIAKPPSSSKDEDIVSGVLSSSSSNSQVESTARDQYEDIAMITAAETASKTSAGETSYAPPQYPRTSQTRSHQQQQQQTTCRLSSERRLSAPQNTPSTRCSNRGVTPAKEDIRLTRTRKATTAVSSEAQQLERAIIGEPTTKRDGSRQVQGNTDDYPPPPPPPPPSASNKASQQRHQGSQLISSYSQGPPAPVVCSRMPSYENIAVSAATGQDQYWMIGDRENSEKFRILPQQYNSRHYANTSSDNTNTRGRVSPAAAKQSAVRLFGRSQTTLRSNSTNGTNTSNGYGQGGAGAYNQNVTSSAYSSSQPSSSTSSSHRNPAVVVVYPHSVMSASQNSKKSLLTNASNKLPTGSSCSQFSSQSLALPLQAFKRITSSTQFLEVEEKNATPIGFLQLTNQPATAAAAVSHGSCNNQQFNIHLEKDDIEDFHFQMVDFQQRCKLWLRRVETPFNNE